MNLTSTIITQSEAAMFVSGLCLKCLDDKEHRSSKFIYSLCHDKQLREAMETILSLSQEDRNTLLEFVRLIKLSEGGAA